MVAVDLVAWVISGGSVGVVVAVSLGTLVVIGLGSLYRLASLGSGGDAIATQLGGELLLGDGGDLNLRRLRNVVEEIAIASGVPVPKIYVLEEEPGINAFAAGYSPSDAVVAVTRGALERLNRDELQGVIAHEFSHILNGDMRLNLRLVGVLFGIAMIAMAGRKVLAYGHLGGRRGRSAGAVLLIAVLALLVGSIGLFFARMIKAGVSRNRERLADASAVQFTRQTHGLAGALKKIGGLGEGSRLNDRGDAEEVSHMLFGDGLGLSGLFATHPPLLKRIQALEPSFKGEQLEALQKRWMAAPPNGLEEDLQLGLHAGVARPLPEAGSEVTVTPPMVVAQVATPSVDDYRRADQIVAGIPADLRTLAARRDSVMPLLLGLLLADEPNLARNQRAEIAARMGETAAAATADVRASHLAGLHPMLRLPLAALAFPVLRLRPRPDLDTFLDTVHAVVHADGKVSLFEYCLGKLLNVQVRDSLAPGRNARFGRRSLAQVRPEVATMLAVVAQCGHADDPSGAMRAYLAGMQRVLPRAHQPYEPRHAGALALDEVWGPLETLDPFARQALVEGITATIAHDNRITVAESELLRTICGVLHCPLPPMLERG